jgi:outer membrane protein OmpA-like peptidoglycan-associated protein
MARKRIIAVLIACAFCLAGCATKTKTGAAVGAGVGTVLGAGIGYAIGGSKGAAIGAGTGLAVGTLAGMGIGRYMDKQEQDLQNAIAQSETASMKREQDILILTFKADFMFDVNSAAVKPGAQTEIARVAEVLSRYPETRIRVEGHTDSTGGEAYNQTLSERRAESVKAELVARNVLAERIQTIGFGLSKPVATNETPEGRQLNRRVQVVIIPQGEAQ